MTMRVLIESTEERVPEDILKLNDLIREKHQAVAGETRRHGRFQAWEFAEGSDSPSIQYSVAPNRGPLERRTPSLELSEATTAPAFPLERWLIQAHAYSEEQAAKVSILGRLFSGEAQRVKAGVIHDAKRFSVVETDASRSVEVGVAARLSVATSKVSGKFELTLPNLAADAQLNGVEARVGITVMGYTGPLGGILPAPKKLDVETCAEYMEAFRKIQAVIFGEAGWSHVIPTTLSYDELEKQTELP